MVFGLLIFKFSFNGLIALEELAVCVAPPLIAKHQVACHVGQANQENQVADRDTLFALTYREGITQEVEDGVVVGSFDMP